MGGTAHVARQASAYSRWYCTCGRIGSCKVVLHMCTALDPVSNTDKLWRTTALIYVDNGQYYTVTVIRSRELGQAPILVFLTPRQVLSSHPCQVLNRINIDFILISRHSKFFYCFWRRCDWDTSCFRSHMHVSKT